MYAIATGRTAQVRLALAALTALVVVLAAAPTCAAEAALSPIPAVPAVRTESAPTIDGSLNDAAWEDASPLAGFTRVGSDRPASQPTVVRLLFDDRALYVGFVCYEPNPDELAHAHSGPDAAVWFDDSVELFIDPGHTHERYLQFALNCTGATFDRRMEDIGWTDEWSVGTRIGADRWTAEVQIPFSTLGCEPPEAGAVFSANFCRNRKTSIPGADEHGEWSCWAPVQSDYHEPSRFGHVIFAEDAASVPLQALARIAANPACTEGASLTRIVRLELPEGVVSYAPHRARAMAELTGEQSAVARALEEVGHLLGSDRWDDPKLRANFGDRHASLQAELERLREQADTDTDAADLQQVQVALTNLTSRAEQLLWDARFELLFAGL